MSNSLFAAMASAALAVFVHLQQAPKVRLSPNMAVFVFVASWILVLVLRASVKAFFGNFSLSQLKQLFVAVTVLTFICMFALGLLDEIIRTQELPMGIVTFELAFTVEKMKAIRAAWTPTQFVWVAFMQGTDHLFMFLYSNAIALGCMVVGRGSDFSYDMAAVQYLAAILDFMEGMFLHAVLIAPNIDAIDERIPLGAGVCASIKFLFVILGLAYFVVMFLAHALLPTKRALVKTD